MNFRRVLLLVELEADAAEPIALMRRVAPHAERWLIAAHVPEHGLPWVTGVSDDAGPLLERVRKAAAGAAIQVETKLLFALEPDTIADLARESGIDLLVLGQAGRRLLSVVADVRKRLALPLLYARSGAWRDRPITEIHCMALGSRARRAIGAFLRDHGSPDLHATVLVPSSPSGDLTTQLDVAGIAARVTIERPGPGPHPAADLLVLARFPGTLLPMGVPHVPTLILPPLPPPGAPSARPLRRLLDVPDLVDVGGLLRARFLHARDVGRHEPIPDQDVAVVVQGRVAAVVGTRAGHAEIPGPLAAEGVGFFRASEQRDRDPLEATEQVVQLIRPGSGPLVLFDAELNDAELSRLASPGGPGGADLLAVRLRATRSCRALRARLRAAGLLPRVVDGSAILDEGAALDVGEELDAVRLARVAARLRGAGGFPVVAIVHRGLRTPATVGFAALTPEQFTAATSRRIDQPVAARPGAHRLEAVSGAALVPGNQIDVELDNRTARRRLLESIAGAEERIHFQVYMALDDDIGRQVGAALAAAGARGVAVRVVVDSLHGFEGSFGRRNRLLERLKQRPGVELRVSRPITGAPSLEALKQRDHRKIVVVDGLVGLLGGRNLSHEYYAAFDEVRLTPRSKWRQVPWLDAGARVAGPAVAELERSFLEAWTEAGGAPFEITTPRPLGTCAARVVVHHGLRDARTLEAYLALIDGAQSHINTVNGFPLMLEIQHALIRAIGRGVRVRSLVGNLTPTHDGIRFKGPWSGARAAATEFVHSRLDDIVAAGGEGYVFAVPEQPAWEPGLGVIHPHVHAKLMTVDGRVCTVGSANMDFTAGYWEDEVMLVVEDAGVAGAVEARVDRLYARSDRVRHDDSAWQRTAKRRAWMRRWPGVLSI